MRILKRKKILLIIIAIVLSATALALTIFISWRPISQTLNNTTPSQLAFSFSLLNVGQGDALLVQSNTGETLLIDGGPDATVLSELKKALPRSDKTIETIILTHSDLDHIAGLLSVVDYYKVNRVLVSGLKTASSHSRLFAKKLSDKKVPLISADMNDDFVIKGVGASGETETMTIDILYPFSPIVFSHEDANNDSVVARLDYRENSILAMGDAEAPVEAQLLKKYQHGELDVDIVKLGHHGSKTSSTRDFILAASPQIAVASMGKNNSYHHPSPSVVKEMKQFGIKLYTTTENGRITIQLLFDGAMNIECDIGCKKPTPALRF